MSKNYQKRTVPAGTSAELVLPEAVTVAMAEIGSAVREGRGCPESLGGRFGIAVQLAAKYRRRASRTTSAAGLSSSAARSSSA